MNNKDKIVLEKIVKHIDVVIKYCADCNSLEEFEKDSMRVEACVFNLMQIGELAKTELSDEAKEIMGKVPWKKIYGMRNRIVHEYSGVDMRIVWDTIYDDLPKLKETLMQY